VFFFKKKADFTQIFSTIDSTPQGAGLLISAYKSVLQNEDPYKQGSNSGLVADKIASTMYLLCYLYLNSLTQRITNKESRLTVKERLVQVMFEPKHIEDYGFYNSDSLENAVKKLQTQLGTVPTAFTGISQFSLGGYEYLSNELDPAINDREPEFTMDLIDKFLNIVKPAFEQNIELLNIQKP
jgi:hypothetical protein